MSRKDHSSSVVKQPVIGVIWDSCRREAYHRYLALPTSTRVGPFPPTFVDKPSHDWRTQRSFHAGATRPDITHENVALCEGDRERESQRGSPFSVWKKGRKERANEAKEAKNKCTLTFFKRASEENRVERFSLWHRVGKERTQVSYFLSRARSQTIQKRRGEIRQYFPHLSKEEQK